MRGKLFMASEKGGVVSALAPKLAGRPAPKRPALTVAVGLPPRVVRPTVTPTVAAARTAAPTPPKTKLRRFMK